jgi:hypothetical protein
MKIVMSGSSGLVGSWLRADLESAGMTVVRLVRPASRDDGPDCVAWRPAAGELDPAVVSGADAVINLNGRSIADGRWSDPVKAELRSSRIDSTRTLTRAIAAAETPPPLLISASATGYYGDRGEEILDEGSAPADDFLARLSCDWEGAALEARSERTRVAILRFGMIIGRGGALAKMLTPFKLGLGGPLGSGRQWWSWIAMEDVIGTVRFLLERGDIEGPFNVVAPDAVRCRDFAHTLGEILRRPAILPTPAFALRLALGEMADALLLASTRVRPNALESAGYRFRVPDLGDAIRRALD